MISTILVCADEASFQEVMCLSLSMRPGLRVTSSRPAGDGPALLANALRSLPEVIIMDADLCRMNGISVLRELRRRGYRGRVILMCYSPEETLYAQIRELGVEGILRKPFDPELLGDFLERRTDLSMPTALSSKISSILLRWGIPANITGFFYAREAITLAVRDPDLIFSLTGKLYPSVAKLYQTTPTRVERNIRHAVSLGWDRGDVFCQRNLLGYSSDSGRARPTNGEFIAALADAARVDGGSTLLIG